MKIYKQHQIALMQLSEAVTEALDFSEEPLKVAIERPYIHATLFQGLYGDLEFIPNSMQHNDFDFQSRPKKQYIPKNGVLMHRLDHASIFLTYPTTNLGYQNFLGIARVYQPTQLMTPGFAPLPIEVGCYLIALPSERFSSKFRVFF